MESSIAAKVSARRHEEGCGGRSIAGILLDKVIGLVSAQLSAPPVSVASNPVGALQEMAQKGGYQMPAYELVQVRKVHRIFAAPSTFGPDSCRFTGEGENKQKAKAQAATAAIASAF